MVRTGKSGIKGHSYYCINLSVLSTGCRMKKKKTNCNKMRHRRRETSCAPAGHRDETAIVRSDIQVKGPVKDITQGLIGNSIRQELELVIHARRIARVALPDEIPHKLRRFSLRLFEGEALAEVADAFRLEAWQSTIHH